MPRFEVTWRAAGPVVNGSRVEACVTIPVKVPRGADPEQAAAEEACLTWERVLAALEPEAPGCRLDVSMEVRKL